MQTQPFTELTPDAVLDAPDSIGLRSDGRLLALNSYENRVYQTGMEGAAAGRQVLPPRTVKSWSEPDYSDYSRLSARWGGWCKMLPLATRLVP